MKRFITIFLVFALLFSMLCFTGCRIGPEECNCHGLTSNAVVNLPHWLNELSLLFEKILDCSCACIGCETTAYTDTHYRDLRKDEFRIKELTRLTNSDGVGSNGYITVSATFENEIPYYRVLYISYKINVYDGNTLVGNAIVTLNSEDVHETTTKEGLTKIINIEIDRYISGDYSLELEYVSGKVR